MAKVIVASNRGPVQFRRAPDGGRVVTRGGGGLATALSSALAGQDLIWIASALSEEDRRAAREGGVQHITLSKGDVRLLVLDLDPDEFRGYYNEVSNLVLFFLHLRLFDLARQPQFDRGFWRAWESYVAVNREFAAVCDEQIDNGGELFVHDYHLTLVPGMLRKRRGDLAIMHMTGCPWADPGYFSLLPTAVSRDMLGGMLGADLIGFLSVRWCRNFLLCCEDQGYAIDWNTSSVQLDSGRIVPVRSYPLGVDADDLRREASKRASQDYHRELTATYAGRALLTRVERMDPVKNLLRGLRGFEMFLEGEPNRVEHVAHFAMAFGSRQDLKEYRDYRDEATELAQKINRRFRSDAWEPIRLELHSNHPLALAAMRRADVLIVNSLGDGMNLVAKEGMILGERDPVLILSPYAGAVDQLEDAALVINPFDTAELADAIATAVSMPLEERAERARRLREAASEMPPQEWFDAQRRDLRACALTNGTSKRQGAA